MLTATLLSADNTFVGVLSNNFTFLATQDCTPTQVSFDRNEKHLFRTNFNVPRFLRKGDEMRVNLDSGIDFYFLVTKLQEPFESVESNLETWRGLRHVVKRIIHEREARKQFGTWDKQIYEVLFHEKQQPIPGRDS